MTVDIIHLLEPIQVHVDEAEDAVGGAGQLNMFIEALFQREAVVSAREQIKFGSMQTDPHRAPGFRWQVLRGGRLSTRSRSAQVLADCRCAIRQRSSRVSRPRPIEVSM